MLCDSLDKGKEKKWRDMLSIRESIESKEDKIRASLSMYQNHLEDLVKHRVLGPAPELLVREVGVGPEKLHS